MALATETDNMISFDLFKALSNFSVSQYNSEYDDSTDNESFSYRVSTTYGRRIHPHFQVIGLIDYRSYDESDSTYWFKNTKYGIGAEFDFATNFSNSVYISFIIGKDENRTRSNGEITSYRSDLIYLTLGKRFPIVGKRGFLTFSPDITLLNSKFSEGDQTSNTVVVNFLKLDLLF